MEKKFYVDIDLLGVNAILNAAYVEFEPIGTAPGTPTAGTVYYDNTTGTPDKEILYFYDGVAWQPMYHYENSLTALGTTPASGDYFIIYDADATDYKKVAYSSLGIGSSYWAEDTSGVKDYIYPATPTNNVYIPPDYYLFFETPNGVPQSFIGYTNGTPDELNIVSSASMRYQVVDNGTFKWESNSIDILILADAISTLYSNVSTFSIGMDSNPMGRVWSEKFTIDEGVYHLDLTVQNLDTAASSYEISFPGTVGTSGYVLQSTVIGSVASLDWVELPSGHDAFTLNATLTDIFTLNTQDLTTNAAIVAGDLILGSAANWGVLGIGTDGYVLTSTSTTLAWEEAVTLSAGVDALFNWTTASRELSITLAQNSLIYASAADTFGAIAAGTDGHILYSNSGVPTWGAPATANIPEMFKDEFVIADWLGSPLQITYTYATIGCGTGYVFGMTVQVYQKSATEVYELVEVGITHTSSTVDELVIETSTAFDGYIVVSWF